MGLAEDYRDQLLQLAAPGRAIATGLASNFAKLFHGFADEFARVHGRAVVLIDVEAFGDTTTELLTDHETDAGLPDPCSEEGQTIGARRDALVRRLTDEGLQLVSDYVAAALAVGFVVTTTEYQPARVGINKCGQPMLGWEWWFALQINGPTTTIRSAVCGGAACFDPLRVWGNDTLECTLHAMQQAHVTLIFVYS